MGNTRNISGENQKLLLSKDGATTWLPRQNPYGENQKLVLLGDGATTWLARQNPSGENQKLLLWRAAHPSEGIWGMHGPPEVKQAPRGRTKLTALEKLWG